MTWFPQVSLRSFANHLLIKSRDDFDKLFFPLRDGLLEKTGGGVKIPQKNSCKENLSKKDPASGDT